MSDEVGLFLFSIIENSKVFFTLKDFSLYEMVNLNVTLPQEPFSTFF